MQAVRELTYRMLTDLGYRVATAEGATGALTLARQQPFDLFLLDVLLAGSSGPALARDLLLLQPHTPVLYVSGYAAHLLEDHAPESTPLEVLAKPFTRETLGKAVLAALQRAPTTTRDPA